MSHGLACRYAPMLCLTAWTGAFAADNLADKSLEELMSLEVTSVSRKRQPISKTAAAVFVITQEDIRRSGATSIPDALRIAPGLFVAQIDSNKWAIGARGAAHRFSNKMLVMIDGRTIYTNLFSGVYWEQHDLTLEDIDRIEVIRGPGGAMWGANAVYGVINIITKPARRTQGLMATAGGGTRDRGFGTVRYGGSIGDSLHYRVQSRYWNRGPMRSPLGGAANDAWSNERAGGRIDWEPGERDTLTFHGDAYRGRAQETVLPQFPFPDTSKPIADRVDMWGGYGQVRWERNLSPDSDLAVQAFVHTEDRSEGYGDLRFRIVDLEFQHRRTIRRRHELLWGGGYRLMSDRLRAGPVVRTSVLNPESRTDSVYSAFLQDDLTLVPGKVVFTAGAKFQHNAYSGFEYQPSVRLLWTPTKRQTWWGAVSRAVRTPARLDHNAHFEFVLSPQAIANFPGGLRLPEGLRVEGVLNGEPSVLSEKVRSYEGGWRWQSNRRVHLDLAGYVADTRNLQSGELGQLAFQLAPTPRLFLPILARNGLDSRALGLEGAVTIEATRRWELVLAYTTHNSFSKQTSDGNLVLAFRRAGFPRNQGSIRSHFRLDRRWSLDTNFYLNSDLPGQPRTARARADIGVTLAASESTEVVFGARNLFDRQTVQFSEWDYVRSSVPGSAVYLEVRWGR